MSTKTKVSNRFLLETSQKATVRCLFFFLILGSIFIFDFGSGEKAEFSSASSRQAEISQDINEVNSQITSYQGLVAKWAQEEETLSAQKVEIESALVELEKKRKETKNAVNENLTTIEGVEAEIAELEKKNEELRDQMAELLRLIYEYKENSAVEILLSDSQISSLLSYIEGLKTVQDNLNDVVEATKALKQEQEEAKNILVAKQQELDDLYNLAAREENEARSLVSYKNQLINQAEASQSAYQGKIASAQELRNSLVREMALLSASSASGPITFEFAVATAKKVGDGTGVRPALLLGVLKQETNFGANTGTATYHTAYHGSSAQTQISFFKQITSELGMDPETTKVSAWPGYGSGGAMGPCQFMPQTWMGYRGSVSSVTGNSPANPWDLNDCMTAMGLKLAKGGAASRVYDDEWRAVGMYFAGGNWNNPRYAFYPNNVMALASGYEQYF